MASSPPNQSESATNLICSKPEDATCCTHKRRTLYRHNVQDAQNKWETCTCADSRTMRCTCMPCSNYNDNKWKQMQIQMRRRWPQNEAVRNAPLNTINIETPIRLRSTCTPIVEAHHGRPALTLCSEKLSKLDSIAIRIGSCNF